MDNTITVGEDSGSGTLVQESKEYISDYQQGRRLYVQLNGIAIVTDPRMKLDETVEITFGVWIVHPDSYENFAATIVSKGLFVRDMKKREAKRLNQKALEFMNRAVKTLAKLARNQNE